MANIKSAVNHLAAKRNSVMFSVTSGSFGLTRKVDASCYEIDADKELTHLTAKLLDCPEVRAIASLDVRVVTWLTNNCLPATFKRGIYLVPITMLEDVEKKMAEFAAEREALVNKLGDVYFERLREVEPRLRVAFRAAHYPTTVEGLKAKYYMTYTWMAMESPENLPEALRKKNAERMEALWREAEEGVKIALRSGLLSVINELNGKLSIEDGKPKIFRDTVTKPITEFLDSFKKRNIVGDKELEALVEKVREIVNGVDPQVLRDDLEFREVVRKDFETVSKKLGGMIEEVSSRRKFRFE